MKITTGITKLLRFNAYQSHFYMRCEKFFLQKAIEELREKYIKDPPEGMTAQLVKNMSDSDLLDMHYFLTEDEYFDGEEEDFYIDLF